MKVGLLADTHMPGSISKLWPQVYDAFTGVDHILHAGDLHTLEVVDELGKLAPTIVSRGNGDAGIVDARIEETWTLEWEGVRVAMIHHFPTPGKKPAEGIEAKIERLFDQGRPNVIIFGHTHAESIQLHNDVLLINPGSPTLPQNQTTRMGTVGMLEIYAGEVTASLYQITEEGLKSHQEYAPVIRPRTD